MNVRAPIQTAFLLLFCATFTLTHERAEAQTRHSFFAEVNDGDLHYRWTDGDDLLEVRIEGDVSLYGGRCRRRAYLARRVSED